VDRRLTDAQWRRLRHEAARPYLRAGRFAHHFARGKLGMDPVFRHLVESGALAGASRWTDIGCGQALLASLANARARLAAREGDAAWPASLLPAEVRYTGIDLMPRDIERARQALDPDGSPVAASATLRCGDMRTEALPPSDLVVILDVLHYVRPDEQDAVIERVRASLSPTGRLLLRVGDMQERAGFGASQWVDRIVTAVRGHRAPPVWGRTLAGWTGLLERCGFRVEAIPMSRGTPFANVLLDGRLS